MTGSQLQFLSRLGLVTVIVRQDLLHEILCCQVLQQVGTNFHRSKYRLFSKPQQLQNPPPALRQSLEASSPTLLHAPSAHRSSIDIIEPPPKLITSQETHIPAL